MEVPTSELGQARWHKSSYSGAQGGCVEVAELPEVTAVRDTKNRIAGTLIFPRSSWLSFSRSFKHAGCPL
jgi:hypothetical protein